jgi:regulation of enolase protein 1 (concanavalin A-like superfamily)
MKRFLSKRNSKDKTKTSSSDHNPKPTKPPLDAMKRSSQSAHTPSSMNPMLESSSNGHREVKSAEFTTTPEFAEDDIVEEEEPTPLIEFRPVPGFESIAGEDDDEESSAASLENDASSRNATYFDTQGALLKWYCAPDSWPHTNTKEGKGGWWEHSQGELLVGAPAKKDFWRKTYYEPLLIKDDGPLLCSVVPISAFPCTMETSFTLTPKCQFDQAGIVIRIDSEHWIKTGIEVVDGIPRLSCVVTNGFSDWSAQTWTEPKLRIRVHMLPQHGGSYVVEACPLRDDEQGESTTKKDWSFVRIAHLNKDMNHNLLNDHPTVKSAYKGDKAPPGCVMAGVFAACPEDQKGSNVMFHDFSIVKGSTFQQ